jgi:competence ComEA-like helix-hairpin-helix protein
MHFKKIKWKEYFDFSRSERNGVFLLLIILFIIILLPYIYAFIEKPTKTYKPEFENEVTRFEGSLMSSEEDSSRNMSEADSEQLFPFDPNYTTFRDWKKLGLSDKQIKVILNYLSKGGKFYKKDDLKKMYCVSPEKYRQLEPYIIFSQHIAISEKNKTESENNPLKNEPILFSFDPNTATEDEFLRLGLNENQVKTIRNFISKGGKFYKKDDFKKMYGLSEKQYNELEPYIEITKNADVTAKTKINKLVELNSATSEDLQNLKGIGSYYSKMIIKYRDLLGGYINLDQLLEVYNMRKETVEQIKPYLTINQQIIKKININIIDYKSFKHPYLQYKDIKNIIDYRTKHGLYTNIKQLTDFNIISETSFKKVEYYLTIE